MKKAFFCLIFIFFLAPFSSFAQMKHLTLQERIQMASLVLIVEVEKSYKGEGEYLKPGNWFAECIVKEVLIGSFREEKIKINFKNVRRRRNKRSFFKLLDDDECLVFLNFSGEFYQMISPYQGGFKKGKTYKIMDENSPVYPNLEQLGYEQVVERVKKSLE